MADSTGLLELEGKGKPDAFLVSSIALLVFLIADIGFTGFRAGNLGAMVTAFLFIISTISYIALSKNVLLSDGHILDGSLGWLIGSMAFTLTGILTAINLNLLSSATTSYLSGILGPESGIIIPIVNNIFAPIGETFLIFGLAAGIYQVIQFTRFKDSSPLVTTLLVGLIPSLVFSVLHGTRGIVFFAFSFTINMAWTALIVYGEKGQIKTKYLPIGLGLIVGLHHSFNVSNYGGTIVFLNEMFGAVGTQYGRSASAIIIWMIGNWILGLYRLYLIIEEEDIF